MQIKQIKQIAQAFTGLLTSQGFLSEWGHGAQGHLRHLIGAGERTERRCPGKLSMMSDQYQGSWYIFTHVPEPLHAHMEILGLFIGQFLNVANLKCQTLTVCGCC